MVRKQAAIDDRDLDGCDDDEPEIEQPPEGEARIYLERVDDPVLLRWESRLLVTALGHRHVDEHACVPRIREPHRDSTARGERPLHEHPVAGVPSTVGGLNVVLHFLCPGERHSVDPGAPLDLRSARCS